jgi:predicted permease
MASGQGNLLGLVWHLLVVLLGVSSGVTAVQAGASVVVAAGAAVLGLAVGAVVVTVALPTPDAGPENPRTQWDE